MVLRCFGVLILVICSLCGYVCWVSAAISSMIMVSRMILVDVGSLLGSYLGAVEPLGSSIGTAFEVMIGEVHFRPCSRVDFGTNSRFQTCEDIRLRAIGLSIMETIDLGYLSRFHYFLKSSSVRVEERPMPLMLFIDTAILV